MNSSKGGTQSKRVYKKGEDVRTHDMPGPAEEIEKNQKILLWLMEGQKEMVQHKRSPYGLVASVNMSANIYVLCSWCKILLLVSPGKIYLFLFAIIFKGLKL